MKVRAENLTKRYRANKVVDGVSFEFEQGKVVGLLGPNGAGKTTTFYIVTGLIKPNSGKVFFDDKEVTNWPMYKRARKGLGYLAQESSVFRRLSVRDNLKLVLEMQPISRQEMNRRIDDLASKMHIEPLLGRNGGVLSGGERRRVEIARALATEPKFILLDEPFTGIDPVTIEELQEIIRRLAADGIGILITDHNVGATLGITDINYILIEGRIIAEGSSAEIQANELVRKYYLGRGFRSTEEIPRIEQDPPEEDARREEG